MSAGLWPRTVRSRRLLVRLVWLFVALFLNATDGALGPVQVGAIATVVCLWGYARTGVPVSLVQAAQRSVTLLLVVVCGAQWQHERLSPAEAGVLALAVATQWWVEEDHQRAVLARAERLREQLTSHLEAVSAQLTGTKNATITAVQALESLPTQTIRVEAVRQAGSLGHRTPRAGLHRSRSRRPEQGRRHTR